jgi:hypothetical protein
MFRENKQHKQKSLFSSIDDLPAKQRQRLQASWAASYYDEVFVRIDETVFAVLYSDQASRPNTPINMLVSTEIMKAGFGWSDAELEEQMAYNLQVRYAVGYRDVSDGHFELRTLYNFRRKLTQHMQETGENLLEVAFEQITDEQIKALKLKTGKLRMDSVQIGSNIRQMSRLQLLVEVLQRVWRMLSVSDQAQYEADFEAYRKGSSGQYVYHVASGEAQRHLESIGYQMQQLVTDLKAQYGEQPTYQVLARVFDEHFVVEEAHLRPKKGDELSAQSLQSPDGWEATYRAKCGEGYQGYVTNVTETCDPDNDVQLIVKVQTESNNTDDAAMLDAAIPNLVERTDVKEMYTDGGYNSSDVDATLQAQQIEQYQSAIRGQSSDNDRLGVSDFVFARDDDGAPQSVQCPNEQTVTVIPAQKDGRFTARFDADTCAHCPFFEQCPTKPLKRKPQYRILRFDQQQVNVAHRRENQRQARASGRNLRSAVEATVRSVKHPFGNGKVPVRGKPRVSMMMVASAAMTNARRIWRSQVLKVADENAQMVAKNTPEPGISSVICTFLHSFFRSWMWQIHFSLATP